MEQRIRLERGKEILTEKSGLIKAARRDGYINMLNKYGTTQDNSTAYTFQSEETIPDMQLVQYYEAGGLFAKIIDAPAEEAIKHGFDMGLKSPDVETYIEDTLDYLEWEDTAMTAIKWSRLFGGAIIVMLINDGGGIDEPLNWKAIKSIDELRVYERALVQPDYTSLYNYDPNDPLRHTGSKFGMPEYYQVFSMFGTFKVHESRCLVLRNGKLPERTNQTIYRFWGTPEYFRIKKELRETLTSHSYGVKMLERSVQAIYSMKNLAQTLATDEGEEQVIKRLQVIDMARGILNSIAIDSEGENYDFKNITLSGAKDILDSTCNMLSAVTNIPQTILFGRSPAGQNSTGESDFENWYNYIERIQKMMLRGNLRTLIDIVIRAGLANGKLEEESNYKLEFNPLWSKSDKEQADEDSIKATTAQTKAATAQIYVDMGALDPSEVRKGLAQEEEFVIEELLDDMDDDELWGIGGEESNAPIPKPEEQGQVVKEPVNPTDASAEDGGGEKYAKSVTISRGDAGNDFGSVGVIVINDGKILAGHRAGSGEVCGPGGHIESGETPAAAAIRETREEFGITPTQFFRIGKIEGLDTQYGEPYVYVCTDYEGEVSCSSDEMSDPFWMSPNDLPDNLFPPFDASVIAYRSIDFSTLPEKHNLTNDGKKDKIILGQIQSDANDKSGSGHIVWETVNGKEGHWITMNGSSLFIGRDGAIQLGKFAGMTPDQMISLSVSGTGKITTPCGKILVAYDPAGKKRYEIGKPLGGMYTFAGNGGGKALKAANRLSNDYGGKAGNWSHSRRKMEADFDGVMKAADVHWFYEPTIGYVEPKITHWY